MATVQHSALTTANLHEPKGVSTATAGQVYVADGAASGSWGNLAAANVTLTDSGGYFTATDLEAALQEIKPFIPAHGGLYINANATSQTATGAGTWDNWTTGWTDGLTEASTVDNTTGEITVTNAGTYLLGMSLSVKQSGASAATWLFGVAINGTPLAKSTAKITTSGTDTFHVTVNGLLTLAASDIVRPIFQRTAGTTDPTIEYGDFILTRIL